MKDIYIAITAASYSGNKGAAAMLQSSISQLYNIYGEALNIKLMSVYPDEDCRQAPWDFVQIVSCKPEQLILVAFPLAILYRIFRWFRPIRLILLKNKILKAYSETDMVLDEAGISFVDSRGFIMNTYAFICAAVPLLMDVPVVKYSQAMGPFQSFINRFLAKWILPKMSLICARGAITRENLKSIGIDKNVKLCADGAFTMPDIDSVRQEIEEKCENDLFFSKEVVGLSISSVVAQKCEKQNINYIGIMSNFADYLIDRGYHVLIIANSARINSQKIRNNDLMACEAVYKGINKKEGVRWKYEEFSAEEIREYIGHCRYLVASRFHAMIGALEKKVPVFLIGWSHKYQEVLDSFQLGDFCVDFSSLSFEMLIHEFEKFVNNEEKIREKIEENYESVMASSKNNIKYIKDIVDEVNKKEKNYKLLNYTKPEKYAGSYLRCRYGYATDSTIRENAASGGMITALLCYLLRRGIIDGAWVTKTEISYKGELEYRTFIATTEEEIRSASSSVYMDIPLIKHIGMAKDFQGKLAVVMTPCMLHVLTNLMEKDPDLKEKIIFKFGLYCSGNHAKKATEVALKRAGISMKNAHRLYYRRGHWRGQSSMIYCDGSEKIFSYAKTICAYKNAYFYEKQSCMLCQDHYARYSDISFGDVWLGRMKKSPIKYTSCIIRTPEILKLYSEAVNEGVLKDYHLSGSDLVKSQKRALVFKYNCALSKQASYSKKGKNIKLDVSDPCRWNHRLAFFLAERNRRLSERNSAMLEKIPMPVIYYYMCFIRVLLSW